MVGSRVGIVSRDSFYIGMLKINRGESYEKENNYSTYFAYYLITH